MNRTQVIPKSKAGKQNTSKINKYKNKVVIYLTIYHSGIKWDVLEVKQDQQRTEVETWTKTSFNAVRFAI